MAFGLAVARLFLPFSTSWVVLGAMLCCYCSVCFHIVWAFVIGVNNNSIDFQSQVLCFESNVKCAEKHDFFPHTHLLFLVNMTIKYYQEWCTLILSVINARTVNALLHMPQAVLYNVRENNTAMSLIDLVVSKTTNKTHYTFLYVHVGSTDFEAFCVSASRSSIT